MTFNLYHSIYDSNFYKILKLHYQLSIVLKNKTLKQRKVKQTIITFQLLLNYLKNKTNT